MEYGNISVIFMVIAVVAVVLGIALGGLFYLNRAIDKAGPIAPSAQ